ncbi:hypothetical protein SAVIM40S_02303 [Streptomyces avidinii]
MGRSRRAAADHRGHRDPPVGRETAQRRCGTSPSGCGGRAPAPIPRTSTAVGRRSFAGSTWSTPSDCSSRLSAGPGPNCGTRRPPTAGPGSSWPHTLSSASPARSHGICVGRGSGRRNQILTPARVRRGFRNLLAKTGTPARAPKPTRPGPGRPLGSKKPTGRHPLRRRTSPRHRRGIQPPRTPQEGDEAATNGMSCKSGATAQPSLAGSPHDVLQKGPCRVDGPGASAPSSGRGTGLPINPHRWPVPACLG